MDLVAVGKGASRVAVVGLVSIGPHLGPSDRLVHAFSEQFFNLEKENILSP